MKTLNKIVEAIQQDPNVKRFKELEAIIDQDANLQADYKSLLNAQKVMVQREVTKHKDYEDAKQHYESLKEKLLEHVLMSEYLDLLETLNEDIHLIQTIIEDEINIDFD